jgi:hypothetical protein
MRDEHDPVAALEADLAALAAADADLERDAEAAERTRIERAAITLANRLRAARAPVRMIVIGGATVGGLVAEVGSDAVLLRPPVSGRHEQHLVRLDAVIEVGGLDRGALAPRGRLHPRSTTALLRAWCRDRSAVSVALVDGSVRTGVAGAAYADHLDLVTSSGPVAVPFVVMAVVSR